MRLRQQQSERVVNSLGLSCKLTFSPHLSFLSFLHLDEAKNVSHTYNVISMLLSDTYDGAQKPLEREC